MRVWPREAFRGTTLAPCGGCAALAFVSAAGLLQLVGSLYLWAPICLGLIALAHPLRRRHRSRLPSLGWQPC